MDIKINEVATTLLDHNTKLLTEYGLVRRGETVVWFWTADAFYAEQTLKRERETNGEDSIHMVIRRTTRTPPVWVA